MQKLASGGAAAPQFGQRRSSSVPHAMQKRAEGGFSVAQLWQMATAIQITVIEIHPARAMSDARRDGLSPG